MKKYVKNLLIILSLFAAACFFAFLFLILSCFFKTMRVDKNKCVKSFVTPENQIVVTVGTMHSHHFERNVKYSIADIYSILEYFNPDFVFIESRPEIFEKYGVLDGPVEMLYVYAYCNDKNIPVFCIDWWQENNETRTNSTTEERDDRIFINICKNLENIKEAEKVLVFYGTKHFYNQQPRMKKSGWKTFCYGNPKEYFSLAEGFYYPSTYIEENEKKIRFYKENETEIVETKITDINAKEDFKATIETLCQTHEKIIILVSQNKLFYDELF